VRKYTRETFDALVIEQSPADIEELLGKPSAIQTTRTAPPPTDPKYSATWSYGPPNVEVTDPATGKPERRAQLVFEGGQVVKVIHR
jgi:hypothetical protein